MNIVYLGAPITVNLSVGQTIAVNTNGTVTVECVSGLGLTDGATIGSIHGSATYGPFSAVGVARITATVRDGAYEVSDGQPIPIDTVLASSGKTVLDDASRAASQSVRSIALPSRAAKVIQSPVFLAAGRASIGRTPKSFVPLDPRVEATQYYVDITNGNDANTGLSWAQAFKSIWKATTAGNTAAVPYAVNIAAGRYSRANNFANASATVIPTQSCVFRAVGGQVECHVGGALTWALDSGTTYSSARSNVKRVIDWGNVDSNNDYLEIPLAASLADCRATPNSWYTDNVTVYVNRLDGAVVSDANTSAMLTNVDGIEFTTSGSMHMYGITQIGGVNGAIRLQNNVNGKFYAEDCKFSYSTNATSSDNVTSLDVGLVVMNRCISSKGQKDGFNYHTKSASIPQAIHFDCLGYENGTVTSSTSNNGATAHDAGLIVDFNGRYFNNYGGDFAHAGAGTLAVAVCTQTYGSYGDIGRGGVALPGTGFHAIASAEIYKFDCVGSDQITSSGTITQG